MNLLERNKDTNNQRSKQARYIIPIEETIIDFINNNLGWIYLCFVTMLGIVIRIPLRHFISGDAKIFLLPWYKVILENGLSTQVGDYNFPYQLCIYIFTKLPINPLYAFKLLSCIFDFLLAIVCGAIVYDITKKWSKGLLAYSFVLISPIVILNSAAWAQCDSIFVTFAILGIYMLLKEKALNAMLCFGLSLAFKLQAVFFFPALVVLYLLKKYSILYALAIPFSMFAISVPMVFVGRNLVEVVKVYASQTHTYPSMMINYPSLYGIFTANNYAMYSKVAILLTIFILSLQIFYILYKRIEISKENLISLFFVTVYTCVLFLPSMHERYGYPYEVLACILLFIKQKTLPLYIGLVLLTLRTYSSYLFGAKIDITLLSYLNVLIYLGYIYLLTKNLSREKMVMTKLGLDAIDSQCDTDIPINGYQESN